MDKWWKTLDKAGDERGTRGDKRDLCQDGLRLFHTAGIMKGRNSWARAVYRPTGCERVHTLSRSPGAVLAGIWVFDTSPRVTGSERVVPLARSPVGLCWRGFGFLTVQAFRRRIWLPTKRAWGAPLPYIPSGDGVREGATLSRSPGAVLAGIWVFDGAGAGVLVKNLASDEAGVGRSAPLHPLGRRGARGCDPLALSRGAVLAGIWVFTKRWFFF